MSDANWPHQEHVDYEWYRCHAYPAYDSEWICPGEDGIDEDGVGAGGCADCMIGQMAAEIERLRERAVPEGRILLRCQRCDGLGATPPRPGKSRADVCCDCNGTGYDIDDHRDTNDVLQAAIAAAEAAEGGDDEPT